MKILKRTKIITTIGPVSENVEVMTQLFNAGMTTIRLNFSHGNYEEHKKRIDCARIVSKNENAPISIMLDTKGPEIRIGKFKNGSESISKGEKVTIFCDKNLFQTKECEKGEMTVEYNMSQDLEIGKPILIDDGKLLLITESVQPNLVTAIAQNSHIVKPNKRINLPGTKFSMPFLSSKDIQDIEFGCDNDVDYIAASFTNSKEDILQIREILRNKNASHIQIIAKIESQYAVDHIDEIIDAADGIMVARGDLGLEIPFYEVPVAQKMMVRKCREAGKPVIVATQMLDSMEKTPLPTRAEVTDVFLATEQGADSTMLSGESAAGQYPIDAVHVMATINSRAEKEFYNELTYRKQLDEISKISDGPRAEKAKMLAETAFSGHFKFAIVLSRTGELLKEVAKFRPNTNILGVTNNPKIITKFGITSSVFMHPDIKMFDDLKISKEKAKDVAKLFGALSGDAILLVENNTITDMVV